MRVLSIDFGTSNTTAVFRVGDGALRAVFIDGSPLIPSSVFLTQDGTVAVGRDADRQARIDPSRYEPHPKRRIDDGQLLLGDAAFPVPTIIARILVRVAGEARLQLGETFDQVRLTHPARWGRQRLDTMITSAYEAGLPEVVLIPEPVAAATHFAALRGVSLADGRSLAVYDLGGGTFDLAIVRRVGITYEVIAEAGLPDLGGLDFDHAIIDYIGHKYIDYETAAVWSRVLAPSDAGSRRLAHALAHDVREAKEALSRHSAADIPLISPLRDIHLTRAEFEAIIRPDVERSIQLLHRTIAEARLSPSDLAGVYLVGGSSRIPLVAQLIHENLGIPPITQDQPETTVASGAACVAVTQTSAETTATPGDVRQDRPQWSIAGRGGQVLSHPKHQAAHTPTGQIAHYVRNEPRRSPKVRLIVALCAAAFVLPLGGFAAWLVIREPNGTSSSTSQTGLEQFFPSRRLLEYVRPTFAAIDECLSADEPNRDLVPDQPLDTAHCTYKGGIDVGFSDNIPGGNDYAGTRETMQRALADVVGGRGQPEDWPNGQIIILDGGDSGAVLYWDDQEARIWAVAASLSMDASSLRDWWFEHFGSRAE